MVPPRDEFAGSPAAKGPLDASSRPASGPEWTGERESPRPISLFYEAYDIHEQCFFHIHCASVLTALNGNTSVLRHQRYAGRYRTMRGQLRSLEIIDSGKSKSWSVGQAHFVDRGTASAGPGTS